MQTSELKLLEHHHQLTNAILLMDLPRGVKHVLVAISTYFNVTNQSCSPNRKSIAERAKYCPNYITEMIRIAVDMGLIKSTAQYYQVDGEAAPRQIANKYEFNLEKFGLYYSKAKALLNKNLRKKSKSKASKKPENYKKSPNQQFKERMKNFDFDFDKKEAKDPPD